MKTDNGQEMRIQIGGSGQDRETEHIRKSDATSMVLILLAPEICETSFIGNTRKNYEMGFKI